jgi:hypothetical protein
MSPPGVLANLLARGQVVPGDGVARPSSANVRLPAATQVQTVQPFAIDGPPGKPAAPATAGGGGGTRLRRVLLRWQAPQPCPAHRRVALARLVVAGDPYVNPYGNLYVIPYALRVRTPTRAARGCLCRSRTLRGASRPQKPRPTGPPQGEWSGHAARSASRD